MIKPEAVTKIAGDLLGEKTADAFVGSAALARLLSKSLELAAIAEREKAPDVYPMMVTRFINRLIQTDRLIRIRKDLYANMQSMPRPGANAVAGQLRPGAVISLHTVLGESAVGNNPSRITYAVVPEDVMLGRPSREASVDHFGEFRFLGMARAILEAGDNEDRLDTKDRGYLRATNERALCDWIYFATKGNRSGLQKPPLDLDLDEVDRVRLHRLAVAMGIEPQLDAWLERKAEVDADVEASEQVSLGLGF